MQTIHSTTPRQKLYLVSSFSQDVLKAEKLPLPQRVWGRMSCSQNILLPENRDQLEEMISRRGKDPQEVADFLDTLNPDRIFWGHDEWVEIEEYALCHPPIPQGTLMFVEYHRRLAQFVYRSAFEKDFGIPHDFAWNLLNRLSDAADLDLASKQDSLPPIAGPASPWEQALKACGK